MSLLDAADQLREAASRAGGDRGGGVARGGASRWCSRSSASSRPGSCAADDPARSRPGCCGRCSTTRRLAEVALTRGRTGARPPDQLSVFRLAVGRARDARDARGARPLRLRRPPPRARRDGARGRPFAREAATFDDPTLHATFETTAAPENRGGLLWSDLHYTALDAHLPERERRVVVTALKAVDGRRRRRRAPRRDVARGARPRARRSAWTSPRPADPHLVFLCDDRGRLVSRLSAADVIAEIGRRPARGAGVGPARGDGGARRSRGARGRRGRTERLRRASTSPAARTSRASRRWRGRRTGASASSGPRTTTWASCGARRRALVLAVGRDRAAAGAGGGRAPAASLRRGLGRIVRRHAPHERVRLRARRPPARRSATCRRSCSGLELAKTAMRAMSRYVPVDLVRGLYASRPGAGAGRRAARRVDDVHRHRGLHDPLRAARPDALARAARPLPRGHDRRHPRDRAASSTSTSATP